MSQFYELQYVIECDAAEAERLFLAAGDDIFCTCQHDIGGFANPDSMTRVMGPCRMSASSMRLSIDGRLVQIEATEDEAKALLDLIFSAKGILAGVVDQIESQLADIEEMRDDPEG